MKRVKRRNPTRTFIAFSRSGLPALISAAHQVGWAGLPVWLAKEGSWGYRGYIDRNTGPLQGLVWYGVLSFSRDVELLTCVHSYPTLPTNWMVVDQSRVWKFIISNNAYRFRIFSACIVVVNLSLHNLHRIIGSLSLTPPTLSHWPGPTTIIVSRNDFGDPLLIFPFSSSIRFSCFLSRYSCLLGEETGPIYVWAI